MIRADFSTVWGPLALAAAGAAVLLATAAANRASLRAARRRADILNYLADQYAGAYALDIIRALGIGSGSLYPALARLESEGRIKSWWCFPEDAGRPRRRLYALARPDEHTG